MNDNSKRRQADVRRAIHRLHSCPNGFAESLAPGTLKPLLRTATPGRRQCYNVRRVAFDRTGKVIEQGRGFVPKAPDSPAWKILLTYAMLGAAVRGSR